MTDEIMVPMAILAVTLLLYVDFFRAMREWIQVRVVGKSSTPVKQGPPASTVDPNQPPYQQPPLV